MAVPPEQPPVYPPPGTPVEQPTAPLDPVPPRQVPAYRNETYVDPRPGFWRLEALRTALTIVGLIALIAVGLAVWALIRADRNHGTSGAPATAAGMAILNRRVNNLEASVRALSSTGGNKVATARSLSARIAAVQQSERQLASQVSSHGGSTAQVTQLASKEAALSGKVSQWVGKEAALAGQVSQLQGRVAQLKGQVAQLNGQTTTQTTSTGSSSTTP